MIFQLFRNMFGHSETNTLSLIFCKNSLNFRQKIKIKLRDLNPISEWFLGLQVALSFIFGSGGMSNPNYPMLGSSNWVGLTF